QPQVRHLVTKADEVGTGYANDGERLAIQQKALTHNLRITAKASLPEFVCQHDDGVATHHAVLGRSEETSAVRPATERREVVVRNKISEHFFGSAVGSIFTEQKMLLFLCRNHAGE